VSRYGPAAQIVWITTVCCGGMIGCGWSGTSTPRGDGAADVLDSAGVTAAQGGDPPPTREDPTDQAGPAWPNWFGPLHDGVSHESDWSPDWPSSGLPVRWTRDVGIGFSAVAIAHERLYTMGHVDGKEVVHCLNIHDGSPHWEQTYSGELLDNLHDGGPGATPTIDADYVYTLGKQGQFHAWNAATGEMVWRRMLPEDLGVDVPEWGFASSPYVLGDLLILEGGRVVAYDKRTGAIRWKTEPHAAGYGSASPFLFQGRTLLATLDCDGLRVTDAEDGREVAFVPWESRFQTNATTPIVVGDQIFLSTAYDVGCGLFRLTSAGLELVYKNRAMRNHFNNSILFEGDLYGFDGNSNLGRVVKLTCMDFATGEVRWQERGFGCGSLIVANGKLLILSEDGTLVVAQATPDGYQEIARSPFLEGRCWTVPVVLSRRVYGRNAAGKLVCVELPRS